MSGRINARPAPTAGGNGHSRRRARPNLAPPETLIVPALARLSLRSLLTGRRIAMAALVSAIPLLLAGVLIAADASDDERGGAFTANMVEPIALLVVGATVPFIAMLLAGSIVADDVEDRTFSYILVRPLRRRQVYLSRLLPAAVVVACLAAIQVVAFALLRFISWAIYGQGSQTSFTAGGVRHTMPTWQLMLEQAGLGVVAAVLAGIAFLALFSFVTLLTTRYHFLANVLTFASVELLFGNIGGQGAGIVTITYHARSLLMAVGPSNGFYHPAPWWLAAPVLLAMAALWTWAATWQVRRRDFNVTSAAS